MYKCLLVTPHPGGDAAQIIFWRNGSEAMLIQTVCEEVSQGGPLYYFRN